MRQDSTNVPRHRFLHTVNGKGVDSDRHLPVLNPATEQSYALCPIASRSLLDEAVASAREAFRAWRRRSVEDRRNLLCEFADSLVHHCGEIAEVLTSEQGKPLRRAEDEILRAATQVRALVSIPLEDEQFRNSSGNEVEVIYKPLGVVGAITPWNMPIMLAVIKIAHALYTGNTVVLKPSPYTPLATLLMGQLVAGAFPPGVLNIVAGEDELGRWMSEHAGIDKISFTGSGATGRKVMSSASGTLKRVTLELGGNDAAIVLPDVDLEKAVPRLFAAAFVNSGQVCMAIKRLYVHDSIYEPVCRDLAALAKAAKVGDGADPATQIGPIQNAMQYRIVLDILADTRRVAGARFLAGGEVSDGPGYFFAPTVVADVREGCRLVDEEQFGPILPVIRFSDVDDAVARANATPFGLGGSVWSRNVKHARDIAAQLDVGVAWINSHVGGDPLVPFGGRKASGIGRESSLAGLRSYMEATAITIFG